jgi:hypothetical protein
MEPIVGTEALGRPLTKAEREHAARILRAHDFAGASLVALRFAYKKTRSRAAAQDLLSRVNARLVRQGWDPKRVTLTKCLCRFVFCEWSHQVREWQQARAAEEVFLRERKATEGEHAPSVEEQMERLDAERRDEARAIERVAELRASFLKAKDEVNLLWLEQRLAGVEELSEMAKQTGRDVREFYRAADRRKRHVVALLALRAGDKKEEE